MALKNNGNAGRRLEINTVTRKLVFYEGGRLLKEYPVAVGKSSTPTPSGNYKIINKKIQPGGIFGTRWMGLSIPGGIYGIHGTNNPSSIGTAASLGCIRMLNHNVEELFPQISIGTPVTIYNRSMQNAGKPVVSSSASVAEPTSNQSYTVTPGDTLWDIAGKFNVSTDQIIAANNLGAPDLLQPGQVLLIP